MEVSTFINLICNFVGIFSVLFGLYDIEYFGQKTSVQHHSSYFIFPLVHFYIKMVQWDYEATRMLLLKPKNGLEISLHALSLSFKYLTIYPRALDGDFRHLKKKISDKHIDYCLIKKL